MASGTRQIAQGNDPAIKLPRSQNNRYSVESKKISLIHALNPQSKGPKGSTDYVLSGRATGYPYPS